VLIQAVLKGELENGGSKPEMSTGMQA
jgi:hypothetical protein